MIDHARIPGIALLSEITVPEIQCVKHYVTILIRLNALETRHGTTSPLSDARSSANCTEFPNAYAFVCSSALSVIDNSNLFTSERHQPRGHRVVNADAIIEHNNSERGSHKLVIDSGDLGAPTNKDKLNTSDTSTVTNHGDSITITAQAVI